MYAQKIHNFDSATPFSKLPAFLFHDENCRCISNDAKLLYALLLSRHSLSKKNNEQNETAWKDKNGLFVIYTRKNMAEDLRCSERKATYLMGQLKNSGLVREKRMGLNKANHIYVCECLPSVFGEETAAASQKVQLKTPKTSGPEKSTVQEHTKPFVLKAKNLPCKYINYNDNNINPSIVSVGNKRKEDVITICNNNHTLSANENKKIPDDTMRYKDMLHKIRTQIDYRSFLFPLPLNLVDEIKNEEKQKIVDQLIQAIVKVQCSTMPYTIISGQKVKTELVKQKLNLIDNHCIHYLCESLKESTTDIRNVNQYLLAALFHAPDTVDVYRQSKRKRQTQDGGDAVSLETKKAREAHFSSAMTMLRTQLSLYRFEEIVPEQKEIAGYIVAAMQGLLCTHRLYIDIDDSLVPIEDVVGRISRVTYQDLLDMTQRVLNEENIIFSLKKYIYSLIVNMPYATAKIDEFGNPFFEGNVGQAETIVR